MGDEGSGVDLFYSFAGAFGNAVFLWSVSDAMKAITDRIWTAIPKDGLPGAGVLVAVKYAKARNPNPDLPGTTDYVKGAQVVAGGHNPVGSTFAKTEARKFYDQPKIDVNPAYGYDWDYFFYWCAKDVNGTKPPYTLQVFNVVGY